MDAGNAAAVSIKIPLMVKRHERFFLRQKIQQAVEPAPCGNLGGRRNSLIEKIIDKRQGEMCRVATSARWQPPAVGQASGKQLGGSHRRRQQI